MEIADDIRRRVRRGQLGPDGRVGTFGSLEEDYGAAKGTIEKALGVLRQEGTIVTYAGKGVFAAGSAVRDASGTDADRIAALERRVSELERDEVRELARRVGREHREVLEEIQDHARLLARIRRTLEDAGITLTDKDQRDERAM